MGECYVYYVGREDRAVLAPQPTAAQKRVQESCLSFVRSFLRGAPGPCGASVYHDYVRISETETPILDGFVSESYPLASAPAFRSVLPESIFQAHCLHGGPTCQHRWTTRGFCSSRLRPDRPA